MGVQTGAGSGRRGRRRALPVLAQVEAVHPRRRPCTDPVEASVRPAVRTSHVLGSERQPRCDGRSRCARCRGCRSCRSRGESRRAGCRAGRAQPPSMRQSRMFEFDGCSRPGPGPVRRICAVGLRSGVTLWLEKVQGEDSRSGAARVIRAPGIDGQALPPSRRPSISAQLMGHDCPSQAALLEAGSRIPPEICGPRGLGPLAEVARRHDHALPCGEPEYGDGLRHPRLGPNCGQLHHG